MEGRVDTLLSLSCFTSASLSPHLNLGVFHTGSFRKCHFPLSHAALSFLHTSSECTIPAHCSLLFLKGYVLHHLIAIFIQFMLIPRFSARPFCILHAIRLSHIPAMFYYLDAPLFVQNKAIIPFSFWSDLLCKMPIVITIPHFHFFHLLHHQVFRKITPDIFLDTSKHTCSSFTRRQLLPILLAYHSWTRYRLFVPILHLF